MKIIFSCDIDWSSERVIEDTIGLFEKYQNMTKEVPNVTFGGRLGQYRYYDMHQVIGAALEKVKVLA